MFSGKIKRIIAFISGSLMVSIGPVTAAEILNEPFIFPQTKNGQDAGTDKARQFITFPDGEAATRDNAVCTLSWFKSKPVQTLSANRKVIEAKVEIDEAGRYVLFSSSNIMTNVEARCWPLVKPEAPKQRLDRMYIRLDSERLLIHGNVRARMFKTGERVHVEEFVKTGAEGDERIVVELAKEKSVHCVPDPAPVVIYVGPLDTGSRTRVSFEKFQKFGRDAAAKMGRAGSVVFAGSSLTENKLSVQFRYTVSGAEPNAAGNYVMPSFGYRCLISPVQ